MRSVFRKLALCLIISVLATLLIPGVSFAELQTGVIDENAGAESSIPTDPDEYAKWKADLVASQKSGQEVRPATRSSKLVKGAYIQYYVYDNGNYSIGTDDSDKLTYGFPSGETSDTLIRIDGKDYFFDQIESSMLHPNDPEGFISGTQITGTTATTVKYVDDVKITQTLKLVSNPNGGNKDVVMISYTAKNMGLTNKKIGIRIMIDTMLGSNDGAPFKVAGNSIEYEREYSGKAIPRTYQALDNLTNPTLTATGYSYYSEFDHPDKVQFVNWGNIRRKSWDYHTSSSQRVTYDSAVAFYFNEESVAPNKSKFASTYYGAYNHATTRARDSFEYDNNVYNRELALKCAQYAAYAYQDYKYNSDKDYFYNVEHSGDSAKAQGYSAGLKNILKKDGYDTSAGIFWANYANPQEDTATYVIAHKKVIHDETVRDLLTIVIRGTNEEEWKGNMKVTGTSYDSSVTNHKSFQQGALSIERAIENYVDTHDRVNNPMVLITGHSRGGAIGNLLAFDLTNGKVSKVDSDSIYAYLFAVPNVTQYKSGSSLTNIYNFCFTDDFVPSLPLGDLNYCFRRGGKEYDAGWHYCRHGITTTVSAHTLNKTHYTFPSYERLSVQKSGEEEPSFNEPLKTSVIDYVAINWANVYEYYNRPKSGDSLFTYMYDTVAPAAIGDGWARARLKLFSGEIYKEIANFFADGFGMRQSINDTHHMFTYYNALKVGGFPEPGTRMASGAKGAESGSSALSSPVRGDVAQVQQAEADALRAFANTGDNLSALQSMWTEYDEDGNPVQGDDTEAVWDLDNPETWDGVFWDEDGYATSIMLPSLGLEGSLDLSAFERLTILNVQGNALTRLTLPLESVLERLVCSGNELDALDISGQTSLTMFDCSANYLDEEEMKAAVAELEESGATSIVATCGPQKHSKDAVYAADDVAKLRTIATDDELLDFSDDPSKWVCVAWVEDAGTLYVKSLDLTSAGIVGELDLSGLSHLVSLNCSNNEITSLKLDGCSSLVYVNCSNNKIASISGVEGLELQAFFCTNNLLGDNDLVGISAETVDAGWQGIDADPSEFDADELAVLSAVAEAVGYDASTPGKWQFVTWKKTGDTYHAAAIDLQDQDSASIGDLDLSGFGSLKSVVLSGCSVTSLVLPDGLEAIGDRAFYGCAQLESVKLPANLKTIGEDAFVGCESLTRMFFPSGLTDVSDGAFADCSELSRVYFTGDKPKIGEDCFINTAAEFEAFYLEGTNGWASEAADDQGEGDESGIGDEGENEGDEGDETDEQEFVLVATPIKAFDVTVFPRKVDYAVGDALDVTGLELLLLGTDGSHEDLSAYDVTIDAVSLDEPGEVEVGVSYAEHTCSFTVTVHRIDLSYGYMYLNEYNYIFTNSPICPKPVVTYDDETLSEGVDYELSYENNENSGYATVIASGIGRYEGELSCGFYIKKVVRAKSVSDLQSEHDYANSEDCTWEYAASGSGVTSLHLTFSSNTQFENECDYLYIYDKNDSQVGCYTGSELAGKTIRVPGNAMSIRLRTDGSVTDYGFKVTKLIEAKAGSIPISSCTIKLSKTSYVYSGKPMKPSVTVREGSITLNANSDYVVSYASNTAAGTAKVIVKGKGEYGSSATKTFTIKKATNTLTVTGKTVKLKAKSLSKKKATIKPSKAFSATSTFGSITYSKVKANKKNGKFKVAKTGKITVGKGLPKGVYKLKVKATVAGTTSYDKVSKKFVVVIRVR